MGRQSIHRPSMNLNIVRLNYVSILMNFSTIVIKVGSLIRLSREFCRKVSAQGMGFTTLQTTLLGAASSGVQIVGLIIAG